MVRQEFIFRAGRGRGLRERSKKYFTASELLNNFKL
jgi:hypothetical protein